MGSRLVCGGCWLVPTFCTADVPLPADGPGDTPESSLRRKCEGLIAAISATCGPRFVVDNVDCDPNPGQMTSFSVSDTACVGTMPPPGLGLDIAIANSLSALSSFQSGEIITDYERDTVFPGCRETAGNGVIITGQSDGESFIPGTSAAINAVVTLGDGREVSGTVASPAGQKGPDAAALLAERLNATLIAIDAQERCFANDNVLRCGDASTPGNKPTLSVSTNVATLNRTTVAGSQQGVQELLTLAKTEECPDITRDCAPLGQNITHAAAVPATDAWSALMLIVGLVGGSFLWLRRQMRVSVA
jgi:hypothetical protein